VCQLALADRKPRMAAALDRHRRFIREGITEPHD
jgi:hypothetical protein